MNFVVTPTYNEKNNIKVLVEKLYELYPDIHVMVVDDNSPDGTAEVVKELQQKHKNLHLKVREGKLGLASAYLDTLEEILENYPEAKSIITMDADLSHDPLVIKAMHEEIETHDLVIGARYIKGGGVKNWELWRRLLSRGGNFYARLVTMSRLHDLTTGFHCFRTSLLRQYNLSSIDAVGFGFLMIMKIKAERLGATIKEVPIIFPGRVDGESKLDNNIIYEGLIIPWTFSPLLRPFRSKRDG